MQVTFDFSDQETLIGVYILASVYILLWTPLNVYYTYQIWSLYKQNELFITKRRPMVVIVSSISFNIYGAIIRPIADYLRATRTGSGFLLGVLIQLIQIVLVFICIRLWLLFFDYKKQIYALNHQWKSTITHKEKVTSWTHTHRWLGNAKVVTAIGLFFAFIVQFGLVYLLSEYCLMVTLSLFVHLFIIAFYQNQIRNVASMESCQHPAVHSDVYLLRIHRDYDGANQAVSR